MATYYVATTGNNSNNGSEGSPRRTIASGVSLMSPGDTLRVRGGTYDDDLQSLVSKTGTALNRYTVEGYPGETVLLMPGDGRRVFILGSNSKYITIRNFIMDGGNNSVDGAAFRNRIENNATSIVIEDCEIRNNWAYGCYVGGCVGVTFRRCHIHHMRTACVVGQRYYGFYLHHGTDIVVEDCEINDNPGGGIQAYPGPLTGLIIRRNRIYRNNILCTNNQVGGITVMEETSANGGGNIVDPLIYNNAISNNDHSSSGSTNGIRIGQGVSGAKVYNNSIYGSKYGINIQTGSAGAPSNTILTNNIIRGSVTQAIANAGTGTVQTTNLTTDPHFVNPLADDLRILADSDAIDAGTSLAGTFTDDLEGNTRPGGASWDIGAYEFQSTPPDPEDLDTYYVHPTTGNDTNTGAEASPFLTIAKGLSVLEPGDKLILRGGTHTMAAEYGTNSAHTFGGQAASWNEATVIQNYPGEAVVIKSLGFNMDSAIATGGIGYLVWEGDSRENFIVEAKSGASNSAYGFRVNNVAHHVRFKKVTVRNFPFQGIFGGSGASTPSGIEIIDCEISNNGNASGRHGIQATRSTDWIITDNLIKGNRDYGIYIYNAIAGQHTRCTIQRNRVEGRNTGATGTAFGIRVASGSGHKVHQNIINGQGAQAVALTGGVQVGENALGAEVYNNTINNVAVGTQIDTGSDGTVLRNNIYASVTTRLTNNGTNTDAGFSLCASGCLVNGLPSFSTPGSIFTLNTGSLALGAGSDVGYGEDIGAYQSPYLVSASVEDATPNQIILNFSGGVSPLLPASGVTGFTTTRNAVSNVVTSAVTNGSTVVLTVTTPISDGDVVTVSYSSGNLTDSYSNAGDSTRQGFAYALVAEPVTNNVNNPVTIPVITGLVVRRL